MREIDSPHLFLLVVLFLNLDTFCGQFHNLLMLTLSLTLPITVAKDINGGKLIVKPVLHLWVYFLKCFPNKMKIK